MFQRFTHQMRDVATAAVAEAERRGDRHIGTEHLVLGLVSTTDERLRAGLDRSDLTVELARHHLADLDNDALAAIGLSSLVLDQAPGGGASPVPGRRHGLLRRFRRGMHRPFTSGSKDAFERCLRVALDRGDSHIGVEHLAAVLGESDARDPGVVLLARLYIDPAVLADVLDPPTAA